MAELDEADRVDFRSCGGAGAGLYLLPPDDSSHVMDGRTFAVSLRRRLRFSYAARATLPTSPLHCNHRSVEDGAVCGACLDAGDLHAATCGVGGGLEFGHNAIRDWLAAWIEGFTGRSTDTEVHVPAWDVPVTDAQGQPVLDDQGRPKIKRARLDVAFIDGEGRRCYVDVAVTSAATTSAQNRAKRAGEDGAAAADMVRVKRSKYPASKAPNNPLVPFVVEALGRLSPEAQGLLNAIAPEDKALRSVALRRAKQTLSVLVQTRLADLLLDADVGRDGATPLRPAPPAA